MRSAFVTLQAASPIIHPLHAEPTTIMVNASRASARPGCSPVSADTLGRVELDVQAVSCRDDGVEGPHLPWQAEVSLSALPKNKDAEAQQEQGWFLIRRKAACSACSGRPAPNWRYFAVVRLFVQGTYHFGSEAGARRWSHSTCQVSQCPACHGFCGVDRWRPSGFSKRRMAPQP